MSNSHSGPARTAGPAARLLIIISLMLWLVPQSASAETADSISGSHGRSTYVNLRTNLLYDAALLPSVGAEVYLGRQWSVAASWTYGWWSKNRAHRYWRAYGGDIAVRWWPGHSDKPLTGHHVGAYAGIVTYDFEFGGKGYMGGQPGGNIWQRCNRMAGLEYGYTLPLSRRLSMDFTIGIGYLGGTVFEYRPQDSHYVWQSTRRLTWVGPTKAEVSLVWLLGGNNINIKKGGNR